MIKSGFILMLVFGLVGGSAASWGRDAKANFTMQNLEPGQADGAVSFQPVGGRYTGGCSGTVEETWGGITYYNPSSCTGTYQTYASRVGARAGFRFDSFLMMRSLLSVRQFTIVRSSGNCPGALTNYNYLMLRGRSKQDFVGAMDFTAASTWVGGTFSYSNSSLSGISRFSLANLSAVSQSTNGFAYGSLNSGCASGEWSSVTSDMNDAPFSEYAAWLFGSNLAVSVSSGGNPVVTVAVPVNTLSTTSSFWQGKNTSVYSGLMTYFTGRNTQNQKNVYFISDSTGKSFNISEASSLSDTTQRATLGTLSCGTVNSPSNGFCSGTLAFASNPSATGNAVCLFSFNTGGKDLLFCAAQNPSDTTQLITFLGGTSAVSKLSVAANPLHLLPIQSSGNVLVTVTNLTARPVSTLSPDLLTLGERLATPFTTLQNTHLNGVLGSGGFLTGSTCGTSLPAYSSCTIQVGYSPATYRLDKQTFRLPYDKSSASMVNATTTLLASRGLSSLTVSAADFTYGSSSQATVTATFADGSTQDVTALVDFSLSNNQFLVSEVGDLLTNAAGSTILTATFGNVSGNRTVTAYAPPPAPTNFTATAASSSQINLSWSSGGTGTVNYQIAYQTGATAPSCGTPIGGLNIITAATQGSTTNRSITGLTGNTQYSFRVCATNATGWIGDGVTASATTHQQTDNPTQLVSSSINSTTIFLSWTAGAGASQYQIAYQSGATAPATCSAGTVITGATQGAATKRSITDLSAGTQYSFRVCSVSAQGTLTSGITVTESTKTCNTFVACTGDAATCASNSRAVLSGGTLTFSGADDIHTFTASGTLTVTTEGEVLVLLVGGGGGGGGGNRAWGGGGGGGVLYGKYYLCTGTHTVTVGAGGAGKLDTNGLAGGTTTLNTLSAFGGNGSGAWTGASSGIAQVNGVTVLTAKAGGTGYDPGVSFSEYRAGGGGGAGGIGGNSGANNGGNGGVGLSYDISGTSLFYAGGGGGALAQNTGGTRGQGGSDVGADGGINGSAPLTAVANRGGGGGGGGEQGLNTMGFNKKSGSSGSAGVVILRYTECASPDGELSPCAPTGVSATAGNAQASLTWTAPSHVGAGAVTDYSVQYSSDSGATWTTFNDGVSAAANATVTGLLNGTAYIFRVAAVNVAGTGNYSASSSAIVPNSIMASGGTITEFSSGGLYYVVHSFTAGGTFTISSGSNVSVSYFIVGGGGGGGSRQGGSGGGGAGGVLTGTTTLTPGSYTVTVGSGGAGGLNTAAQLGGTGGNSSALGFTANGGGGGAPANSATSGASGGSGGGGSSSSGGTSTAGAGTAGQGNSGGIGKTQATFAASTAGGGGGGGAGSAGSIGGSGIGGAGGAGTSTSIRGTVETFAGGGGGGGNTTAGAGGSGGGGTGGNDSNGIAGTANTGSGGGGSGGDGTTQRAGGAGGSGIVIIRYHKQ